MMTCRRLWGLGAVLLLTGLLAAMIGCSAGEDVTGPPGEETVEVGPEGGAVASSDENAMVVIPPGALDQIVEFTVVPANQPPAGSVAGTAYDFGPDGTQFSLPATISVGYDEADLGGGVSPQSLQLCRVVGGSWIPLASFTLDEQAHLLAGATTHLSIYGIVIDEGGPVESSTAYLTDSPDPQNPEEFDNLAGAMAWLESRLGFEDQGILVWQTSTAQQVESLAYSFDWLIEVEEGVDPAIEGPAGSPLVIEAAGAIDLSAFDITAPAGLVVNANRALSIAGCNLPDDVLVNIGGVKGAPFPAGDPGYSAKSDRAEKLSRGTVVSANHAAQSLSVQVGGAESVNGSIAITENQTTRLMVGGSAVLYPDVALTVSGPPVVPVPYPVIYSNLGGNSRAVIKDFQGAERLITHLNCAGGNLVTVRDIGTRVHVWSVFGTGTPTLQYLDSTADSVSITPSSSTVDLRLSNLTNQSGMFIHAQGATGNVAVQVEGGTYEGGLQVDLPGGGSGGVILTESTHNGGQMLIGSEGGSSAQVGGRSASVTLTDLVWNGSTTADHIDIFGVNGPVNVSGGTYSHSGTPAVILGLTEIGGGITIEEATFNGAGIGLVDCTGAASISGINITMAATAAYGLSMGGCAAVTLEDCSITAASGGIGVIQAGEMAGNVTITGCTLNGATAAHLATLASSNVTMDDNPLLSGRIFIIDSQVHLSGNTFSAAEVWDDYNNPGLQNDPVQDNDGLLPGMCYTRMDWDGNGCCDYPPEWNVTDEYGACAVCQGVGGKFQAWH